MSAMMGLLGGPNITRQQTCQSWQDISTLCGPIVMTTNQPCGQSRTHAGTSDIKTKENQSVRVREPVPEQYRQRRNCAWWLGLGGGAAVSVSCRGYDEPVTVRKCEGGMMAGVKDPSGLPDRRLSPNNSHFPSKRFPEAVR